MEYGETVKQTDCKNSAQTSRGMCVFIACDWEGKGKESTDHTLMKDPRLIPENETPPTAVLQCEKDVFMAAFPKLVPGNPKLQSVIDQNRL